MRNCGVAALGTAVILFVTTRSAFAGPAANPEPTPNARTDLSISSSVGADFGAAGPTIGGLVLGRWQMLGVGAFADVALGFDLYAGGGVAVGPVLRMESGFRCDLLGTLGYRDHKRISLLDADPGVRYDLPFAGVRIRTVYVFSGSQFELGLVGRLESDLYSKQVEYDYYDDGTHGLNLFGNTVPQWRHVVHTVGGTNWAVLVTVGKVFDL